MARGGEIGERANAATSDGVPVLFTRDRARYYEAIDPNRMFVVFLIFRINDVYIVLDSLSPSRSLQRKIEPTQRR
jgi:hypothetical protein